VSHIYVLTVMSLGAHTRSRPRRCRWQGRTQAGPGDDADGRDALAPGLGDADGRDALAPGLGDTEGGHVKSRIWDINLLDLDCSLSYSSCKSSIRKLHTKQEAAGAKTYFWLYCPRIYLFLVVRLLESQDKNRFTQRATTNKNA
jgi:hypothetical protein